MAAELKKPLVLTPGEYHEVRKADVCLEAAETLCGLASDSLLAVNGFREQREDVRLLTARVRRTLDDVRTRLATIRLLSSTGMGDRCSAVLDGRGTAGGGDQG